MPDRTALLLATGPSLARTWRPPPWRSAVGYHLAIAVNEAIRVAPHCSWWVAADARVIRRVRVPRYCWLCTSEKGQREAGVRAHRTFESLGQDETAYSAVAALHLAAATGCTRVITYGVDLAGAHHVFDRPGETTARGCNPHRWQRERAMWNDALTSLGIAWDPAPVPTGKRQPKT